MSDKEQIVAALAQLDPLDDDQWTTDGAPRVDAVEKILNKDIKRQDIIDAAPHFSRETAGQLPEDDDAQAGDVQGEGSQEVTTTEETPAVVDEDDDELEFLLDEDDDEFVDTLTMTQDEILADPELLELYIIQAGDKFNELVQMQERIKGELKLWSERQQIAERILSRKYPGHGKKNTSEVIRQYLDAQVEAREKRAAAATAFIMGGTNPADVAKALAGASALDKAMSQRKAKPGSTRPAPRMPVQRGSIVNT